MGEYNMSMRTVRKNTYELYADGRPIFTWGVDGENLLCSAGLNKFGKDTDALLKYKKEITSSKIFMLLDVNKLSREKKTQVKGLSLDFLTALNSITLKVVSLNDMVLSIEAENKQSNFLKQLFE